MNKQLSALRSVNSNLYAIKVYFETRPVYLEQRTNILKEKFRRNIRRTWQILSLGKDLKKKTWTQVGRFRKDNETRGAVYQKRLLLYEKKINGSMRCYESMRESRIMWRL